jgi:hypothetical protein
MEDKAILEVHTRLKECVEEWRKLQEEARRLKEATENKDK